VRIRDVKRAIGSLVLALATLPSVTARQEAPNGAEAADVTVGDLIGTWAGDLSHDGETTKFALHLEQGEEGKVLVKMSAPSVHVSETPIGRVTPQIQGHEIRLGPFSFTYDRSAGTLTGVMPESLVPIYRLPLLLRGVERFEVPSRPELSASIAKPVWTFDAGAPLWPGATFADGIVYGGGEDGVLHAIVARTGKPRWSFRAGGAIRSRATVTGEGVFFQADDGYLYKLVAVDGVERWRSPEDASMSERTTATSWLSIFRTEPASGTSRRATAFLPCRPSTGGTSTLEATIITSTPWTRRQASSSGSAIRAHRSSRRPPSTTTDWSSAAAAMTSSARIRDGVAYVGSSDAAGLFAIDVRSGRRVWESDVHGWAWGQPAVTADRVYIGTVGTRGYLAGHAGGALAVDRATGRPVWRYGATAADDKPFGFAGSPVVGARLVFFTGLDGRVYAFAE
jgi:outer membrane protein assembly factor BamB